MYPANIQVKTQEKPGFLAQKSSQVPLHWIQIKQTKKNNYFFCWIVWTIPLILACLTARISGMLPSPQVFEKEFTSFHTSSKLLLKVFFGLFTLFFNMQPATLDNSVSPSTFLLGRTSTIQRTPFSLFWLPLPCQPCLPGWGLFETSLFPECRFPTSFAYDPCSE